MEGCQDDTWCMSMALWRGARWRKTLDAVLLRRFHPPRRRLNHGNQCLGWRRWDDPIQRHVDATRGEEIPWHKATDDRSAWSATDANFVARVLRRTTGARVPHTRWTMPEHEN